MIKFVVLFTLLFTFASAYGQLPMLSTQAGEEVIAQKREAYPQRVAGLESYRASQWKRYQQGNAEQKLQIIKQSRETITEELCGEIFPAWYGTQWAFSGTSKIPGEGQIACGYFVSTCLLHAGFKVQRIKLAQQASQKIITTMTGGKKDVSAGKPMEEIVRRLKQSGDGIYIVGLDSHVGFVTVKGDDVRFVHSNYYRADNKVVCEVVIGKNPLNDSSYRVFGKLLDDKMMLAWLKGDAFVVK